MAGTGWLHDRLAFSPIGIRLDSPFPLRFTGSIIFDLCSIDFSTLSSSPFVHDFPWPTDIAGLTRFAYLSSGFYPPRCYQRINGPESSVLLVNLPPFLASPPWDLLCGLVWTKLVGNLAIDPKMRASPGKVTLPHRMPSSFTSVWLTFQILELAHSRLLVPPPLGHIAGLLFATYTVSTSCFLRTLGWPRKPLPCWCCPSV